MKSVLVTGANGHVGANLCRQLVAAGYRVRGTVRDLNDPAKTNHIADLDMELVQADIMDPTSLTPVVAGIDGVFQVAAVFKFVGDAKEVRDASVIGGINVLRAAHAAGIGKVVFTSSVFAVGISGVGEPPRDENDWNTHGSQPYIMAKAEAERAAWDFAEANGLNLVTILPTMVLGPGFASHTPSTLTLGMLSAGMMPVALHTMLSTVDVRDVARAHILAYENDQAKGRYIVSSSHGDFLALARTSNQVDPTIKVPKLTLPKALLFTAPWFDRLNALIMGTPRMLSKEMVDELLQGDFRVNCDKARNELGWEPQYDLADCLADTYKWIKDKQIPLK